MEVLSANSLKGNDRKFQLSYFGKYVLEFNSWNLKLGSDSNYFVHEPIYGCQDKYPSCLYDETFKEEKNEKIIVIFMAAKKYII